MPNELGQLIDVRVELRSMQQTLNHFFDTTFIPQLQTAIDTEVAKALNSFDFESVVRYETHQAIQAFAHRLLKETLEQVLNSPGLRDKLKETISAKLKMNDHERIVQLALERLERTL